MNASVQITLTIKGQKFELSTDEAQELYECLGQLVSKPKTDFDTIKRMLEEIKAKQPTIPYVPVPQPYPVPWPQPFYPRRYWDVTWESDQLQITAKSTV